MGEKIQSPTKTQESLSYENIRTRLERLPEKYKPAQKYLLIHMFVRFDEQRSVRGKIALLKTDPGEAKRRYRDLWAPLNLPEEMLAEDEPTPEDIPNFENQLANLEKEETDFIKRLSQLENGDPAPMLELVLRARESHRVGHAFGKEHGINIFDDGPAEGSPVDAILDRAIEALRASD